MTFRQNDPAEAEELQLLTDMQQLLERLLAPEEKTESRNVSLMSPAETAAGGTGPFRSVLPDPIRNNDITQVFLSAENAVQNEPELRRELSGFSMPSAEKAQKKDNPESASFSADLAEVVKLLEEIRNLLKEQDTLRLTYN